MTALSLKRRLPAPNVAGAIAASAAVAWLCERALSGWGRALSDAAALGRAFFLALLWSVVLLNARGVAQFILRPWRSHRYYGFFLIELAGVLAALYMTVRAALEGGAGWLSLGVRLLVGWGVLALIAPLLISKRPVPEVVGQIPVWVWVGLCAWLFETWVMR